MTTTEHERRDIEALLPWHAAGTLSRRDAQRVEAALAGDHELARQLDLVREELGETIHLNETLGAPSTRVMERLLAGIEAEGAKGAKRRFSLNIAAAIAERLMQFRPQTLAWSASIAVLAIVLQAGLLAGIYIDDRDASSRYETASHTPVTRSMEGSYVYALVRFAPEASADDVSKLLRAYKVLAVEPKPGDLYRIKVAVTGLPKEELGRLVKQLQEDSKVIRFVAPTN